MTREKIKYILINTAMVLSVSFISFVIISLLNNKTHKRDSHIVKYTFIDTVKKDTSYEGINIDAICDFLVDSSWEGYDRFGFRSLVDMVIRYGNKDTTIYFGSSPDSIFTGTTLTFDTVVTKKSYRKKGKLKTENPNDYYPRVVCDSATKAFNVMYWKTQCERIKHHNEVLPEESEYLPVLSPDSCNVSFPD